VCSNVRSTVLGLRCYDYQTKQNYTQNLTKLYTFRNKLETYTITFLDFQTLIKAFKRLVCIKASLVKSFNGHFEMGVDVLVSYW